MHEVIDSLREAFGLDMAAAEVQRLANRPSSELTPEQAVQRKAILEVSYKLIYAERNKHLTKLGEYLSERRAIERAVMPGPII